MNLALCVAFLSFTLSANSQKADSVLNRIADFPSKFFDKLSRKQESLDQAVTKSTERYLERMEKQEMRMRNRLKKRDSALAQLLFSHTQTYYDRLKRSMYDSTSKVLVTNSMGSYQPYADSLSMSIEFLKQHQSYLKLSHDLSNRLTSAESKFKDLQSHLNYTEQIKNIIRARQQELQKALNNYIGIPEIKECFDKYRLEAYYYAEQIRNYKEVFDDPDKIELAALRILDKIPAWQEFIKTNSVLARMFPQPANMGSTLALSGLQTRSMIQQIFQTQLSTGPAAGAMLSQNVQAAQVQLSQLQNRILKDGEGAEDIKDLAFSPNKQRTKPFRQRLEYGINIQSIGSSHYFPVTTDIGLSLGYKLNNSGAIGIGGSYKVGWGKDISHLHVTSEGASLRTYLDWKIKGSFYFSGGFERNYQPVQLASGRNVMTLNWTESGLLGVTKTIQIKNKFFRKTKMQLLWDFLSYRQIPPTQPLKFRVGYSWN